MEASKWAWALSQLGFAVQTVAGEGHADVLLPGLARAATQPPSGPQLAGALIDADMVVVENLCSLPLNPAASRAVAGVLEGRRAILHHHDLPWQRPQFDGWPAPPDDPAWAHVTINDLSRRQLARRGIDATTVRNTFDTEVCPGDRAAARRRLGVADREVLLLQPTRAIPRKGVPQAVELAERLQATYWLAGPAEDSYGPELERLLGTAGVPVLHGLYGLDMAGAYAACDAVVFPSTWEGFGNPVIESAIHRRPLAVRRYPVADELAAFGFRWFPAHDARPLAAWLRRPEGELLDHNQAVAARHFSLRSLPERLERVMEQAGWTSW